MLRRRPPRRSDCLALVCTVVRDSMELALPVFMVEPALVQVCTVEVPAMVVLVLGCTVEVLVALVLVCTVEAPDMVVLVLGCLVEKPATEALVLGCLVGKPATEALVLGSGAGVGGAGLGNGYRRWLVSEELRVSVLVPVSEVVANAGVGGGVGGSAGVGGAASTGVGGATKTTDGKTSTSTSQNGGAKATATTTTAGTTTGTRPARVLRRSRQVIACCGRIKSSHDRVSCVTVIGGTCYLEFGLCKNLQCKHTGTYGPPHTSKMLVIMASKKTLSLSITTVNAGRLPSGAVQSSFPILLTRAHIKQLSCIRRLSKNTQAQHVQQ
ncbi:uncharacterized protein PITG_11338 [Phytophthora infestans T30-4]|uniref:Uncharacterized protein n=1 Tax=Phytophthora infestans (strain T30-4) TaxID=403677 RepID=D0NIK1_PHYIT|nr:uncharacterized protein PITG_11338 [Phytophthora infestans T30-4]EEY59335.1 conserved hypothetical protein [Phytophthora infestans T30-4]|eukprot:XP_002900945.1 conserved hypothetical protein [Phytophthora infestans T30-4]